VVGDLTGRLELWDVVRGTRVRTLLPAGTTWQFFAWAADGKLLALVEDDKVISLYDTESERSVGRLELKGYTPNPSFFTSLVFSPDGRWLLSGRFEASGIRWRVWDVKARRELYRLPINEFGHHAAFSPDGKTLVSGKQLGHLAFFDVATGKERRELALQAKSGEMNLSDPNYFVNNVFFSPDGRLLATRHWHSTYLWDTVTGQKLLSLEHSPKNARPSQFSADGQWLIGVIGDHTAHVWEVLTGKEVVLQAHDNASGNANPERHPNSLLTTYGSEVLLWSLRPMHLPPARDHLDKLWADLRSEDALTVYRAIWALSDDPPAAVQLLRRRLPLVKERLNEKQLHQWIADLDAPKFRKRELAIQGLVALRHLAEPYLRQALAAPKSLEQQQRLQQVLDRLKELPGPETLRLARAVQVLERAGTEDCRALLRAWAGGTPGFPLTEYARAALQRLPAK
jgi:hypothetical protein